MALSPDVEELRASLDRIRTMLENLIVRGLRACGGDELAQLKAYAEELERSEAGHVAGSLLELHGQMELGERGAVKTLLMAQTSVRLLERLLTLRVVSAQYAGAMAATEAGVDGNQEGEEAS